MGRAQSVLTTAAAFLLLWGCGGGSEVGVPDGGGDGGGVDGASGDQASLRDVVISEVNWFGSGDDTSDEWIELRNTTGSAIDLSGWTLDGAGTSSSATITIAAGTVLEGGRYLLLASTQGADEDGMRTSLTGVNDVQIHNIELTNGGEALVLRDPDGTLIDETPDGAWAAGNNDHDFTMERRDDMFGGYTDGAVADAWYTWQTLDGTDTTHADSIVKGTPGAANTNPDLFDHFTLSINPSPARAVLDFTLTITAERLPGNGAPLTSYDGTLSVTASGGTLTGETAAQTVTAGAAEVTLQITPPATDVVLTVTDDIYPNMTGTLTIDIDPEGDKALLHQVVISEVNWFGNTANSADEWIELTNVSGTTLNLAGWIIEGAGTGANAVTIDSGTILGPDETLVIGELQGPDLDTMRTSLTGVAGVQLHSLSLADAGEALILKDVDGTLIDETPAGDWPAGDDTDTLERSMERSGLGGEEQLDGSLPTSWHTWRSAAGVDTTHADSSDSGTPGAANTELVSLYASSFETSEPAFELLTTGTFSNTPPSGTAARTGTEVISVDSITTAYTGREIQAVDCSALDNLVDPLRVDFYGTASTDNGGNAITARIKVLWFDEDTCATPNADPDTAAAGIALPQGAYVLVPFRELPPAGASHFKVRFEVHDDNGAPNDGDDWAADDVTVTQ